MTVTTMQKFEIRHRWTNAVLWSGEAETFRQAVETAARSGSNLRDSDLSGSDLSGSDLRGSDLRGSNLRGSNLSGSDLSDSNLRGSNLSGSNLSGSNLTPVRDDLWAVLSAAPREVEGLRKALVEGRVNGSTYEGDCACLVGTIANVCRARYDALPLLKPNPNRPIERFFLGIRTGDTPENSQFAKLAVDWVDQWLSSMRATFGTTQAAAG